MDKCKKDYLLKDQSIREEILELINNVRYSNDIGIKFYSRMLLTDYYKTRMLKIFSLNYYMINNGKIKRGI